MTAPSSGATVSGTTTLTATASDNIGVVGVQFLLDGVSLGAEQTGPFSLAWNTTSVGNGSHTLSARARDAAGNTKTATNVTVTVANTQPLAAWWPPTASTKATGTAVTDVSGNGNNGTMGAGRPGPPRASSATRWCSTAPVRRSRLPTRPVLRLTTGMTLEAWVIPDHGVQPAGAT